MRSLLRGVNTIKKLYFFFLPCIKMIGKITSFGGKKSSFQKSKNMFKINDTDVNNKLFSKEKSYGKIIHLNM